MQVARDTYLDAFKGLLILSVINIHTVYWSLKPFTPDILRELAYFVDIPLFFFISGYLTSHSSFLKTSGQVIRQLIRLYLRYLVITAVVAAGVIAWVFFFHNRIVEGLPASLLSILSLQLDGELWGYFKGYYGNLWYLHTFFPMLLLVPFMIGFPLFGRLKYAVLFFLLILYFLMTYQYKGYEFLLRGWGDIFFYSFIFVLGTTFRIEEKNIIQRQVLLSFGATIFLAWLIFHLDGDQLFLSRYKFPPSFQWLIYSLLLVHVFVLLKPYWSRTLRPRITFLASGLEWIGRQVFTIYLIQGLVCSIPFLFAGRLQDHVSSTVLLYTMVLGFNVTVSLFLAWIFVRSEAFAGSVINKVRSGKPRSG